LDPRAELIVGRVEDHPTVGRGLADVDSVIHLASAVGVGQSMYEIRAYCTTNVTGTATLLQAIVDGKVRRKSLVVASSMSVYGEGLYRRDDGRYVTPGLRSEAQMATGDWELRDIDGQPAAPPPDKRK
jgi:dTDP-L-rhamnose 4-epimerase